MKRIALTIACALASGIGGLALAQQPSPNMQPAPYQQTMPPTTPDTQSSQQRSTESYSQQEHSTTTSGTTSSDKRTLMKDCMAQQEQQKSSTGMSKHDMKKYCKNQVKNETETQPH